LIEQELLVVAKDEKPALLNSLLEKHKGSVLVFARTRHGARKIAKSIRAQGHTAAEIHSDRTLAQRKAALHGFKTGMHRVLVATDIAARGIDVKDISLVLNYDVPENPEDYLHRIGRTGRARDHHRNSRAARRRP
jgi:ATP-dependent RNA helicase RhlE